MEAGAQLKGKLGIDNKPKKKQFRKQLTLPKPSMKSDDMIGISEDNGDRLSTDQDFSEAEMAILLE